MWEEARDHLGPRHAGPPGLLGVGQDLGLDSKNNGKSGKGFKHGWGVARFASLEEHLCSAERNGGSPSECEETRQEAIA